MVKENFANCSSHCDFFEYQYQWCFVGATTGNDAKDVGWKWDYCSALADYSVYGNTCTSECVKGAGGSYGCIVRDEAMPMRKYEACAPDPLIISDNKTKNTEFVVDMIIIENNDVGTDLRYEFE